MVLSCLPCWQDLAGESYRERIAELVEAITAHAATRRAATGIEPLGPAAILGQHPFSQPTKTKKSPAPRVHAASKKVRTEMKVAYRWFVMAFREAAEYLRAGDRLARFPRGSFPPGLPFVRAGRLAVSPATQKPPASPSEEVRPKFRSPNRLLRRPRIYAPAIWRVAPKAPRASIPK